MIAPPLEAPLGIVAGSGIALDSMLDTISAEHTCDAFPGLTPPSAESHDLRYLVGECAGKPIVLQCGRLHFYEGLGFDAVTRTVDVLHDLGARTVLFTNAAGGLYASSHPGDLMAIERIQVCAYRGWTESPDAFPMDFIVPGCDRNGAYHWVHGPCYETRAEIAALRTLDADAVGMSTAPEVFRCRQLGMLVGAIACVTNACGRPEVLSHDKVVAVARTASARLASIIREALPLLV